MLTQDHFNQFRKLTLRRIWNAAKVWTSFYVAKWSRMPVHWGLPIALTIEPTTACNLRCPECPSGLRSFTRPTGKIGRPLFEQIIDELQHDLSCLLFYFQGEPYLNPDFLDMVSYASQKNIYTMTSTNGHFLDEKNAQRTIQSGLDRLIISLDGTTQEVYEQYRKEGTLEKVLEGARNMVRMKRELKSKTPHLIFQFLVVRPNEHQIPDVYRLAREIGVDEVRLKTAQIYAYQKGHPLIPRQNRYSRYRQKPDGTYAIKNQLRNQCWKLWHAAVVTWDGQLAPCCFDKDLNHPMGKLGNDSFSTIWKGRSYQEFRKKILHGRASIEICTNCTEGCKLWEKG
jgi:radical SAM protein with 4Fe4S-binding SPASM domain